MHRIRLLFAAGLATAALIGAVGFAAPATAGTDKVPICHHTGSATNAYVLVNVSVASETNGKGHADHNGHDLDIIAVDPEVGCPDNG